MKSLIVLAIPFCLTACSSYQPMARDPNFASVRPANVSPAPTNAGAIYQEGFGKGLFEDEKARRIGDIVLVRLMESTNATKSASTSTQKNASATMSAPVALGRGINYGNAGTPLFEASIDGSRDFKGEGASKQSNSLTGTIAVTVAEVLANGNLLVRGEKQLSLNQGGEFVRVSGMIRPVDIAPDNTVRSTQLADAQFVYGSEGALADANSQGWFQRVLNSPFWPF